jgi:RNA polymerase sigma-70 factor, ECF subfamily
MVSEMVSGARNLLEANGLYSRPTMADGREVSATSGRKPLIDSDLVLAARKGDRAAFGELYALYARMVHGILLAKVPLNDVNDLVQDVFLRAMSQLSGLRDVERFGPWLAAITRNRAHDYYRQNRATATVTESIGEDVERAAAPSAVAEANAALILASIRRLPGAYRETLMLRLVECMTGPEIAIRTGMTQGSVRVNLHRGMQKLREKLGQASLNSSKKSGSIVGMDSSPEKENLLRRRNEP